MIFRAITPMLETNDFPTTIKFYTERLGFALQNALKNDAGQFQWCSLHRDLVAIMFTKPNEIMNHGKTMLSGSLYLYITEVDDLWESLKDQVNIVYPIENFDYGMREFGIRDNNGYMFNIGCEMNNQG